MATNNNQINAAREQVTEVVDAMRLNVEKIMEREVKLTDLDTRAKNLELTSTAFATTSKKVKRKMWWEDFKMKICIGGVALVILISIIIVIVIQTEAPDSDDNGQNQTNITKT